MPPVKDKKRTGEMVVQTDGETDPLMVDSGVDAAFGPPKPARSMNNIDQDKEEIEVLKR